MLQVDGNLTVHFEKTESPGCLVIFPGVGCKVESQSPTLMAPLGECCFYCTQLYTNPFSPTCFFLRQQFQFSRKYSNLLFFGTGVKAINNNWLLGLYISMQVWSLEQCFYLFAFSQLTSRCKSVKTEKCQRLKNHDWLAIQSPDDRVS